MATSSWSFVLLTAANIFHCTSSIFCCITFPASTARVSPSRAWRRNDPPLVISAPGYPLRSLPLQAEETQYQATLLSQRVQGGDFRGEGSATGPNGETSTETAGKTNKDEVSVDGIGHTSVVISVKLDLATWMTVCSLSYNQTANKLQDFSGQPGNLLL